MFWRGVCCAACLPRTQPSVGGSSPGGSSASVEFASEVPAVTDGTRDKYLNYGLMEAFPCSGDGD